MLFDALTYAKLAEIMFDSHWPGLPKTLEAPNGDGKVDREKRYSHAALKYFYRASAEPLPKGGLALVRECWQRAFDRSRELAVEHGLPIPSAEDSTLRLLMYPPGAGSAQHTDFDLFTVRVYENCPNEGLPQGEIHWGELCEMLGGPKATPHSVKPARCWRYSAVFLAMPALGMLLPSGQTVAQWLDERKRRARVAPASL